MSTTVFPHISQYTPRPRRDSRVPAHFSMWQVTDSQAAVARASAIARVATRTANPPKSYPQKTRGKKASASSSAEKEEDVIELD